MISRKYYLSILASSIFSISIAMEDQNKEMNPIQGSHFTNENERIVFAQELMGLAKRKCSKEVISKAPRDLVESAPVSFETIFKREEYAFNGLTALAMAYKDLGDQETTKDPLVAIEYYMKSIHYVESYLNLFEKIILDNINKGAPLLHCTFVYQVIGSACSEAGNLMLQQAYISGKGISQSSYVKKFKESAGYYETILSLQSSFPREFSPSPEDLADYKFRLYNSYASLMTYGFESEKSSFTEKAKKIHREFGNGSSQYEKRYFAFTTKSLEFAKQKKEVKNVSNKSSKSKKIRSIQQQNEKKLILNIHEDIASSREIFFPHFLQEITAKREYLETLGEFKNYPAKIETIQHIEARIRELLTQEQHSESLYDIYERYMKLFTFQKLKENMIRVILPAFIEIEDIEGALAHIQVLVQLEIKQNSNLSALTRYIQAIIKNRAGDYEEWIAIEQELQEASERRMQNMQQQKEQQKQRQQENRIQAIKATKVDLKAVTKRKTIEQKGGKQKNSSQLTLLSSTQTNDIPSQELSERPPSGVDEKEAKRRRHEKAQKERETIKNSLETTKGSLNENLPSLLPITTSTTTKVITNAPSKIQSSMEQKVLPIKELFHLTAISKKVDSEVEDDTWDFTRENLIAYFKNLGGTVQEGGCHKKLSLPKAIIIKHGEEVVTILNDSSGALTLPRWDKSFNDGKVPHYLRSQILKAREKMAFLQTKVNNLKEKDII